MKKVKSFEEAAALVNYPTETNFSWMPEEEREAFEALYKLVTINKAANIGEPELDYGNTAQCKYEPLADMGGPSGARFSLNIVGCWSWRSYIGVRLASANPKVTEYVFTEFKSLYKSWMRRK